MKPQSNTRLDAGSLLLAMARRVELAALTMRKHEIANSLGICKGCGRLPVRDLPMFGPRCEVAAEAWELAQITMQRLLSATADQPSHDKPVRAHFTSAVGRATVQQSVRFHLLRSFDGPPADLAARAEAITSPGLGGRRDDDGWHRRSHVAKRG